MKLLGARFRFFQRQTVSKIDLRGRLMWLAMLPVLVFAVVWGAYVISQRASDLEAQLKQRAQLLSRQLAIAADYGIFSSNQSALDNLVLGVARETSVISASINSADGRALAASGRSHRAPTSPELQSESLLRAFRLGNGNGVSETARQIIAHLEPIRSPLLVIDDLPEQGPSPSNAVLQGYAIVQVSTESIDAELYDFGIRVAALLVGVLLSSWAMASRFSASIDERIQAVVQASQQIGQGRVGVRLQPSRIPSFNRLSQDINSMASQLEQSRSKLEQRVQEATQALRQQRDAAQQANHDKTRFLAAASHDLRQPMHALNMLVDAAKHASRGHESLHLLERIEVTSQAMSNLLDALLDISRLDAGGVGFRLQPVLLQALLVRLRDTYEGQSDARGVTLVIHSSPACVRTDPVLLERILGNFLSNALRYTPSGGCVLVAVRKRGSNFVIQVRDNGPGIANDLQQSIFHEFVQLHNPQRDRSEGLGLGLAIVQRLANLLGHPIGLRSCVGKGSNFFLSVPQCDLDELPGSVPGIENPTDAGQSAAPTLDECRVLLVEDDALVREGYLHLLQLWNCDVRAHAGTDTALYDIRSGDWFPDVIITDHRLEGALNGRQFIEALQLRIGRKLPAIIISGDTEDPGLRQSRTDTLRIMYKPVKPSELRLLLLELRPDAPQ